uniref:MADF domain-containing protein n=1 Tax=Panagrellus redivivus TaxID=6233 RepID=A0A7E4W7T0_PANRE
MSTLPPFQSSAPTVTLATTTQTTAMAPNTNSRPSLEDLREWPHETVVRLFALVKPHRVLYDNTHEQWMNKTHKGRLWTSIARELDPYLTSRRCRDRFVMMRRRVAADIRRQMVLKDPNIDPEVMWLLGTADDEKDSGTSPIKDRSLNPTNAPTQVPMAMTRRDSSESSGDAESGFASPMGSDNSEPSILDTLIEQMREKTSPEPINSLAGLLEQTEEDRPVKRPRRKSLNPQKIPTVSPEPNPRSSPESSPSDSSADTTAFSYPALNFADLVNTFRATMNERQIDEECRIAGRQLELDMMRLGPASRIKVRLEINQILSKFVTRDEDSDEDRLSN